MRILRIALLLMLFAGIDTAMAQMTDEQIMEYIIQAKNEGKNDRQIGRELLLRGVKVAQIQQLKARLTSEAAANKAVSGMSAKSFQKGLTANMQSPYAMTQIQSPYPATPIGISSSSRVRDDGSVDETVSDIWFDGVAYGESLLPEMEDMTNHKAIYGHQIFSSPALTFEPNENSPTPENYKLGPGDEIIIDIWGASEASIRLPISPEGDIMVSQIGPVYLAGLTIKQAGDKIRSIFARKYAGVSGDDQSSDIRVSLGQLRSMRINVMGEVATPGTYRLSGFASLFHALYSAGGITSLGSLRDIKLVRGGKVIASVDLYEFLFDGKLSTDLRLQEDDVIIVPPYTVMVSAEGELKRPMYYELKPGETLEDLVKYAGGFTGDAYPDELKVVRGTGRMFSIMTVPAEQFAATGLENGDVITAGAILERFDNKVEISGAVYREGEYELNDRVSTVRGLVEAANGLRDDAFTARAILTRKKDDFTFETIAVDLDGIMNGRVADVALMPDDSLAVASTNDIFERGNLSIRGLVANPGEYPFAENTTIEDLILKAGGLQDGASTVKIEVARRRKDAKSVSESSDLVEIFLFDMKDGYMVDRNDNFYLQPYDVVQIRRSPAYQPQRNVIVEGEVLFAGSYSLTKKNERLSDLIARAGGVTSDAYAHGARLLRKINSDEAAMHTAMVKMAERTAGRDSVSVESLNMDDYYTVGIELDKALENPGSDYDMVLREGDRLIIPEKVSTVRINGAVMYPNTVLYQKGQKLKAYISQAGGYATRAKRSKAYIVYMNGTVSKVKRVKGAKMIEPGCEIIVPVKPERNGIKLAEALAIATSASSVGTMAASIANLARRW